MINMSRFKDSEWVALPNEWHYAHVRVLMDIRDELKKMNAILNCGNFIAIPSKLDRIVTNTTKRKPRKKS